MVRIPPIPIPKKMAERYPCQEVDMMSMRQELVARENAEIISASRMVILLTNSPKTTPVGPDEVKSPPVPGKSKQCIDTEPKRPWSLMLPPC